MYLFNITISFLKKMGWKWLQPWWKNLPNLITILRIILTPVLLGLIISNGGFGNYFIFYFFIVLAVTDYLDGFLADKLDAQSDFGAEIDPWADKILLITIFVIFFSRPFDYFLPIFFIVLLVWTFFAEAVNIYQRISKKRRGISMKANNLGKWKCVLQMIVIGILLCPYQALSFLQYWFHLFLSISNLLITINIYRSYRVLTKK